jgi:hypothetical protein
MIFNLLLIKMVSITIINNNFLIYDRLKKLNTAILKNI